MKKIHVVILIAVLLVSTSLTGCSRLNSLLGLNPTPTTHKAKITHTPPAHSTALPTVTPTP